MLLNLVNYYENEPSSVIAGRYKLERTIKNKSGPPLVSMATFRPVPLATKLRQGSCFHRSCTHTFCGNVCSSL